MKHDLAIAPKKLHLPGSKGSREDNWVELLAAYLTELDTLITEDVLDDDRIDYGDDLAKALYQIAKFKYLARGARDRALARGYEQFPKGQYNSDASTALARNFASEEVRLRDLLEEMEAAIKLRASLNQSAVAYYREQMKLGGG